MIMKAFGIATFLLVLSPLLAAGGRVDLSKYPFSRVLYEDRGQYYGLHWNFNIAAKTIHFAVNVSTSGWVGFGVSPTGQMPGSDVVIGWIAENGNMYFHDRYAEERARPPIDESQDWFLISGEEENGFTILEFSRNLTTCDPKDLDIKTETARVVWSFSISDPTDSLGETASLHNYMGSLSVNLLSGLTEPPAEPADLKYFDVVVSNVTIPTNDTTYWCESVELSEDFETSTKYIIRTSPVITPHTRSFVHHMLIYLCPHPLDSSLVGVGGPCFDVHQNITGCLGGLLVGAWAVGGEDFVFPENVAYPVGGPGAYRYIVTEMHYDNPNMQEGVIDNSGMRFFYTNTPRQHDAGMLSVGNNVPGTMVIPPKATNFTIAGLCTSKCTNEFIPEGGIHVFGIFLHTHLAGRALELQHLRWNTECEVWEELPPIAFNPNYDFDYQQFLYLPREVTILPGDMLISRCIYKTINRTTVTFGGLSTREEMCLITPVYYPRSSTNPGLDFCISDPVSPDAYNEFGAKVLPRNPQVAVLWGQGKIVEGLNAINWSPETIQDLENSVLNGLTGVGCGNDDEFTSDYTLDGIPQPACSYQAPDTCTGFVPKSCCERLSGAAAVVHVTRLHFFLVGCLFLISMLFTALAQ